MLIHWWVRKPSCEPNVFTHYRSWGRGCGSSKTRLSPPPPPPENYYWPFQGGPSVVVLHSCAYVYMCYASNVWVVGWCDGPGLTSSAGASYNLDYSRARAYCACSRCGWGCLDIFSLVYHFSFLTPSVWETARFRLKYCLKGPLSPNQPTNQPTMLAMWPPL